MLFCFILKLKITLFYLLSFVFTSCTHFHFVSLVVIRCHSLSFFVTGCHLTYHSLSLVVTCCHSLYHLLSFVVPLVAIRCHLLSFVVPLVVIRCQLLSLDIPLVWCFINHPIGLVITIKCVDAPYF